MMVLLVVGKGAKTVLESYVKVVVSGAERSVKEQNEFCMCIMSLLHLEPNF